MNDTEKRELIDRLRQAGSVEVKKTSAVKCVKHDAADALEVTLWRPIEEAPKDGTKVQLNVEPLSYSEWTARWCSEKLGWVDQDGFVFVVHPTHFKPLDTPETE